MNHSFNFGKNKKSKQQFELINFRGKKAAKVCGKLSLAMKPLKTFLNPSFPPSSAFKILCEPTWTTRTHMDKGRAGCELHFWSVCQQDKRVQRNQYPVQISLSYDLSQSPSSCNT